MNWTVLKYFGMEIISFLLHTKVNQMYELHKD